MDKSLARPNEKQQISSTPQVSTNKPSSPPLGNATPPSASRSPLVGEAPSEQTGHHTQNSAESSSGFHDGASSEALGHSREPSTILPLPPLAATLPPGSTSGPPEEKLHHKLRESPNNDEEYDIMTEIENAIQAANQGESSPNAASMRSGLSSQQDQQQHGMAISTPGLGDKTFDFGSTLTKGEEPPSPPFEPASTTESKDHEAEAPLEREKESDASKMPISMAPTPASPTQDLKSSLRSPSLYSNASFSRTDGQNKKSNARRQSSYTAREEPSIRVLTPSIKAPWATAARLVSIRKQNGDMSWAGWRDVTKLKTSGERAVAYAHKINTLGQTTSGLAMWIALKQVIPNGAYL